MLLKLILQITGIMICVQFVAAQTINLKALKPELFATTGVGVSIPNNSFKQVSNNGFKTYTGVEFQLINHYWTRISYEISLFGYNNTSIQNGYTFKSEGVRTLLGGFLDMGYRKEFKNFAVYGFGGVGVSLLNSTITTVDNLTLTVKTSPLKKTHASLRAGAGIELELKPRFIPFIEYQFGGLIGNTKVTNKSLSFSNVLIGFKARLKRNN